MHACLPTIWFLIAYTIQKFKKANKGNSQYTCTHLDYLTVACGSYGPNLSLLHRQDIATVLVHMNKISIDM